MIPGSKRPTSLTPERSKIVCDAIAEGLTREDAAILAGVHRDTIYEWIRRGDAALAAADAGEDDALTEEQRAAREYEWQFAEFRLAFGRALIEFTRGKFRTIDTSDSGATVNGAIWRLEVARPTEYGRRQKHEHTGADGGPIAHKHQVDGAELLTRLAALAERNRSGDQ